LLLSTRITTIASNVIAWGPRLFLKPGRKYSHGTNVYSTFDCALVLSLPAINAVVAQAIGRWTCANLQQHHRGLLATTVGREERHCAWQFDVASNEKTLITSQSKSRLLATVPGTYFLLGSPPDGPTKPAAQVRPRATLGLGFWQQRSGVKNVTVPGNMTWPATRRPLLHLKVSHVC